MQRRVAPTPPRQAHSTGWFRVLLCLGTACGGRTDLAILGESTPPAPALADASARAAKEAGSPSEAGTPKDAATGSPGGCLLGSTQCFGEALSACGPDGWGKPWRCATGVCVDGACTGETTQGTSCEATGAGLTDCGPTRDDNCCASDEIRGGSFDRSYTTEVDGGPEFETAAATVSGFRLDRFEVTVGRFRQYVNYLIDGGAPPVDGSGKHLHLNGGAGVVDSSPTRSTAYESGWNASDWDQYLVTGDMATMLWTTVDSYTWTAAPGANETRAIDDVTWYEAYAFCVWDGGFLPTEAEWTYAAAGGPEQREYPWGSAPPGMDSMYAIYGCFYPQGQSRASCAVDGGSVAPVGTAALGAGKWGQLDLIGNVSEWGLDWYAAFVTPCADCAYLTEVNGDARGSGGASVRVLDGTAYDILGNDGSVRPTWLRAYGGDPKYRSDIGGFRCARTP